MKKSVLSVFVFSVLLGCSSEGQDLNPPQPGQSCVSPSGWYTMKFKEVSGTCGGVESTQILFESGQVVGEEADAYEIRYEEDPDTCSVVRYGWIYDASFDAVTDFVMDITWDVSGDAAKATYKVKVTDAYGYLCDSVYDVTITKR